MAEQEGKPQEEQQQLATVRTEDFEDLWANNMFFEPTLWGLRIIFGTVDLAAKQINQHTAINIPWAQVKLAAYFMVLNLVAHQSLNGVVNIPPQIAPRRPSLDDPGATNINRGTIAYLGWINDQFFGNEPYVPPEVAAATSVKSEG